MQNLIDLIKQKDLIIPRFLLENYRKMKLTDFEFIILVYYINEIDLTYNPKKTGEYLNVEEKQILEAVDNLQNKNVISIYIENDKGVRSEYINLDKLYNKMGLFYTEKSEKKETKTLFDCFESEFGRTLSPTEFEIINAWKDQKISEDLIKEALKEAIFNGVRSLRYIDAILHDWTKKGYKKLTDIKKKSRDKPIDKKLFEYDWLNETGDKNE